MQTRAMTVTPNALLEGAIDENHLMPAMQYQFMEVSACNMCGAPASKARVLGRRMNRSQGIRPVNRVGICTTVMKCQACDLVFSNPLPVPANLSQHYGMPAESYWTESYFVPKEDYFLGEIGRFMTLSGTATCSGKRALDIGAGVGNCMRALERAGFEAFGIEPSRHFHERALNAMGIAPGNLQCDRLEDARFANDSFDFVTFGAVLEHLYDPSSSIAKALAWVKPGGLIHIEVPSSKWLTNRISNLVYALQGLDYVANLSPMHNPFHLYEFGLRSFEANSSFNGYAIAHHEYIVCRTYLPRAVDFIARPLMAATDTGMQLAVWLRKGGRA